MLEITSNKPLSFVEKLYAVSSYVENYRCTPTEIKYIVDSSVKETIITEV